MSIDTVSGLLTISLASPASATDVSLENAAAYGAGTFKNGEILSMEAYSIRCDGRWGYKITGTLNIVGRMTSRVDLYVFNAGNSMYSVYYAGFGAYYEGADTTNYDVIDEIMRDVKIAE